MIILLDILKTDSVRHDGEVMKTMRIMPKVDDWVSLKPRAMFQIAWDFYKKHFIFLKELSRRIRENGINSRLSCLSFPGCLITATKHSVLRFLSRFLAFISDSDHFFRDPWVPLTFFPVATLVVYHTAIKIREKNNVSTQHCKRVYRAFEWEAKFVWVMRGVLSDVAYFLEYVRSDSKCLKANLQNQLYLTFFAHEILPVDPAWGL